MSISTGTAAAHLMAQSDDPEWIALAFRIAVNADVMQRRDQRRGQALFNAATELFPPCAVLAGVYETDCFHADNLIPAFCEAMFNMWMEAL